MIMPDDIIPGYPLKLWVGYEWANVEYSHSEDSVSAYVVMVDLPDKPLWWTDVYYLWERND